jgi:molecular chaperone GrpE
MPKKESQSSDKQKKAIEIEYTDSSKKQLKANGQEKSQPPKEIEEARHQPEALEQIEQLERELKEAGERYLRLAAEYDNFRKRSLKERDAIYPDAVAAAVCELLPVCDNFDRALAAECADAEYKKGTQMTAKSLDDAFGRLKVKSFGEIGDKFDPEFHNAVMHVKDDSLGESTIIEVFQKGYRIGDRVLRAAMVKVAN